MATDGDMRFKMACGCEISVVYKKWEDGKEIIGMEHGCWIVDHCGMGRSAEDAIQALGNLLEFMDNNSMVRNDKCDVCGASLSKRKKKNNILIHDNGCQYVMAKHAYQNSMVMIGGNDGD